MLCSMLQFMTGSVRCAACMHGLHLRLVVKWIEVVNVIRDCNCLLSLRHYNDWLLVLPLIQSHCAFGSIPVAPKRKEVTMAIIKPDAVAKGLVDDVIAQVKSHGLEVLAHEERVLTKEEAAEFYSQHKGSVSQLPRKVAVALLIVIYLKLLGQF